MPFERTEHFKSQFKYSHTSNLVVSAYDQFEYTRRQLIASMKNGIIETYLKFFIFFLIKF